MFRHISPIYLIEQFLLEKYEKKLAESFDRIVFVSKRDSKHFLIGNKVKKRVQIISNGTDIKKKKYNFKKKNKDIIFIGNINYIPKKMISLEKNFDPDSTWGKWSNRLLKNQYQEIFGMLKILIMIKEKSMRNIYKNRWVQEKTLKKLNKTAKTLTKSDVNQFVMHFERLTRHMFRIMPDYADIIIKKDSNYNYYII